MKILVTGGSGFLGINLVRYLLDRDHQVVSLDIAPFDYPEKDRIQAVMGDIRNETLVCEVMKGVDVVVHAAAALPLYDPAEIWSVDVEGTRTVMEAALKTGVSRVVHISSTAVYGIPDHHPLLENDELIGVGPYGKAKIEAEKVGCEYRSKGLVVSIIRPKSFIGPERLGVFALFYDWASSGKNFPVLGSGKNLYQLLDVEDLCSAIYLCMTKETHLVDDVFNIGALNFGTMKDDYQAVLDEAGFGRSIKPLPAAPSIAILRLLEKVNLSPLYKWVYETANKDSFVSIEKAQQVLGYAPKYSNKEALVRNFRWYVDHQHEFVGKNGVSHRVPWKQGLLGVAKLVF